MDWFTEIAERLRDYSEGDVWSTGDEILCRTESAADAIADLIESLYRADGEEARLCTGYYDPIIDAHNNELDRFTGWWYVDI